jgi:hypothetical protein
MIRIHGTVKDGVIHPDSPLALPDNTAVEVTVVPMTNDAIEIDSGTLEELPPAPEISVEELRWRIAKFGISAPGLPIDFSRADIYSDHD